MKKVAILFIVLLTSPKRFQRLKEPPNGGFFVCGMICRFVNDKANTNSIVCWVDLRR